MKKLFLLFVSTLFLHIQLMAADVLQNVYARKTTSLNGWWQVIIDPYDAGTEDHRMQESKNGFFMNARPQSPSEHADYDFSEKDALMVPGDWNTQRKELVFYEGTVWYKKDFRYNLKKDKLLYLYFGASNYQTDVYLNGEKIGSHEGGFTPFFFDITQKVKKGENFIVARVNNRRRTDAVPSANIDWWNYGGITRDVMLVETPMAHIDDYSVKLKKGQYDKIEVSVQLNLPVPGVRIDVKIPELKISQKLYTDKKGYAATTFNEKPELWSPEYPMLYDIELKCEGERIKDNIGFRHIETKGKQILLNDKPIFLRGVSVHDEAPFRTGRCHSESDDSTLISWSRFLGCNMLRLAHNPFNEKMVRMAERYGLLLWSELPVFRTLQWDNKDTYANVSRQLQDNINRDHNRCAVIVWSLGSDTPQNDARDNFMTGLAKQVRNKDDERLLTLSMEVENKNGVATFLDRLSKYVDIISISHFLGWDSGLPEDCEKQKWTLPKDKPLFISGFGAGALAGRFGAKTEKWTEEYQAEVFRKNLKMFDKISSFTGCAPRVLMDFRSPRRQNHETQNFFDRKGIVSERGQTKQAFYVLQDFYKHKGAFKTKNKK
ncbi:MAG: glycoside hydrolase family 2 TIM barrel-domain containing protein [Prevotellaceae bacterium]|nr:beta-glucuronidase [Prevotella sp.]MDD7257919.1 glycoside hydrolase family 2 TIM barrel-domain containing protein [Prevotellaceae bacterium]MDY6129679.1 glycoside hydrolase family 2 TIM barrel-domain containing protein [Prevotella sp.]